MVNLNTKKSSITGHTPSVEMLMNNRGKIFLICNNILKQWGCDVNDILHILQITKSSYYAAVKNPESIRLTLDQVTRASLIANIYAVCGMLFDNPENRHGFMAMKNHNSFFNGRSPLEAITTGDFVSLYETFKHIDGLKGGQW